MSRIRKPVWVQRTNPITEVDLKRGHEAEGFEQGNVSFLHYTLLGFSSLTRTSTFPLVKNQKNGR